MKRSEVEKSYRKNPDRHIAPGPESIHRIDRHPANDGIRRPRLELAMHMIAEPPAQKNNRPMTPTQAANILRQLSLEARFLRECVGSLLGAAGARKAKNLRFTQGSLDNAVTLFEALAKLAETR